MPTIADLIAAMETIAPLEGAESWDRVGLEVGDPTSPIEGPVFLTIDLTEPVMGEAIDAGASALIAYHPPIWEPIDRVTTNTRAGRTVLRAVRHGIAIYSPHSALDAAEGGITDWLCEGIAGVDHPDGPNRRIKGDVRALDPQQVKRGSQQCKLVTFVPAAEVERVRAALATAGAGRIGGYEVCSFSAEGEGTFLGGQGTSPTVGQAGRLEKVVERRLEMVCSLSALPLAIETLRQFHPYEEPALDVYELQPQPRRRTGTGRRLVLDQPKPLAEIGRTLRDHLGRSRIKLAYPDGWAESRPIERVGIVPGAGESVAELAAREECELFITGEMKHHAVLASLDRGVAVLLAGHTNTERGYLPILRDRLAELVPGLDVRQAMTDRDPLVVLPSEG
ncbi:MAG: Nif3-like dinuclear metal center hexameric protein [Planctomycetota bacterium]